MANRYCGTPQQQEALDAYIKLWRAAHAVETAAHRHLAAHHLTVSQFAVLEALYHLGPLSQSQLSAKILRSSGNLTLVVDNLERGELVARRRDPQDRRVSRVSLTGAGRSLIEQILPQHVEGICELFDHLDPDELAQLQRLTRKLGLGVSTPGESS